MPAPSHRADGKWLTDWLVLDRYLSSSEQTNFLNHFPAFKNGFPEQNDRLPALGGMPCSWKQVRVRGDFFNVRTAVGKDHEGKSAFLFCRIIADRPGDVEFRMSARPEVELWLNGQKLVRSTYLYDDQFKGKGTWIYGGSLQASTNGLLIRISQLGLDRGFALRALPPERTVLTGRIFDSSGKAVGQGVQIVAWRRGREITRIRTDNSGIYHLSLPPQPDEPCDIAFTYGDEGCWRIAETLREGDRLARDVTLYPAVSLSGTLTMLDKSQSPHREVTVQVLRNGALSASVLSDDKGHYRFINLKPGDYQIRCQTAAGMLYYASGATPVTSDAGNSTAAAIKVEEGKPMRNLDFRFAAFKKGFWKRYDTFDGLPNNKVQAIALAPSGELWFQTSAGLGFFDGQNFSTIPGTEGKPITALAAAADGSIWFGSYSGLFRLKGRTLESFTVANGLPDNQITSICAARSGDVWVGTEYGLCAYDGKHFRTFTIAQGLVQDNIVAIGQSPDGSIWAGTGGGLSRYDGKQFDNFTSDEGLMGNEVTALDCSTDKVRVATTDGLSVFDGKVFAPVCSVREFDIPWIKAIYPAADGRLWLGTERGLAIFNGQTMIHVPLEDGLGGGNVASIVATSEGLLWFGTYNGVSRLDPGFANFTTKDGLVDNRIFDLGHNLNTLWFGTEWGGVGRFDGNQFTTVMPNLYARKIHHASDGTIWIGTDKGALRHDGLKLLPDRLLGSRWIMAIDQDPQGGLWLGDGWSGGGLALAQTNAQGGFSLKNWTRDDGLIDNQINAIVCLPGGITWLATGGGLSRFNGRTFKNFTTKDGLPDNMVRTLMHDANGFLWIGTDTGIGRYDGLSFTNITTAYGLPLSRIWCIHKTRDGLTWFGTDTLGACAFDGQAFSIFDTRDGLADNSISAIDEDGDGNLWFGTFRGGLTSFRRKSISPKAHFTQVEVGGKVLPQMGTTLRFRAGEPVTFSFESLDWLTPAAKKQYRICLSHPGQAPVKETIVITKKSDFDWTPELTGDYSLAVQAINQHLVYSQPVQMAFSVFIPWHEHAVWRIAIGASAAGMLITAFLLARLNLSQRREARRLKDLMLAQEQSARAALEDKNRQLEQRAAELTEHRLQLEEALVNVKTLRGLVPICAGCKKIRDDNGFWEHLESFVEKHSEAQFSHGMCPECIKKWYPGVKLGD